MDTEKLATYVLAGAEKYGIILELYDIHDHGDYYMITLWINDKPSKIIINCITQRLDDVFARTKIMLHMKSISTCLQSN